MSFLDIAQSFISSCASGAQQPQQFARKLTKTSARKSTFDKPKSNPVLTSARKSTFDKPKPLASRSTFSSKPKVVKSSAIKSSTIKPGAKLGPQEQAAKAAEKASKAAERLKKAQESVQVKADKAAKAQERADAKAAKVKAKEDKEQRQILAIIAKAEKQQKEQADKAAARIDALMRGKKKSAASDSVFGEVYSVIPDDGITHETDWFA